MPLDRITLDPDRNAIELEEWAAEGDVPWQCTLISRVNGHFVACFRKTPSDPLDRRSGTLEEVLGGLSEEARLYFVRIFNNPVTPDFIQHEGLQSHKILWR